MRAIASVSDGFDIIDRSTETDRLYDRRSARFEPVGRLSIGNAILKHLMNHFAAAIEWRHCREVFVFAVQRADARGAIHLVAGKDIEIAVYVAHIDIHVDRRLRPVDQDRNATRVRKTHDIFYRNDSAEGI